MYKLAVQTERYGKIPNLCQSGADDPIVVIAFAGESIAVVGRLLHFLGGCRMVKWGSIASVWLMLPFG